MKKLKTTLVLTFALVFGLSFSAYAQNHALHFDGSNDYVSIPHHASFNLDNTFTVEGWVRFTDSDVGGIITKNSHVSGTVSSWGLHTASGKARFYLQTAVSTTIDLNSSAPINDGAWHHVAGVKDGNNAYLYIDGVLDQSGSWGGGTVITTYPVVIGQFWSTFNGSNQSTDGEIDEVRVWNVARSLSDIQNTMNTELTGSESGLVSYYNFNQGTACSNNAGVTTLTDLAGSNDGSVLNFDLTGGLADPCDSNWSDQVPLSAPPAIPTMGEWALIIFGLIILSFGMVSVMRWQKKQQKQVAF